MFLVMDKILQSLRLAVKDAEQNESNLKHGNTLITSVLRRIARQEFQNVKHLSKDDVFKICEKLLSTGDWQEQVIAFQWAFSIHKEYESIDFERFIHWLAKYVNSWGFCDDFCTHAFGHLIYTYPEHITSVKLWTESENRWFRRGAAVVLIYGIRRGENFESAFEIADHLLMDSDDLVQKGYGWMLKEISNKEPKLVFDFVMQRKDRMPRTSLRYAIEKLEPDLRKQAMEK
jgi:3-methyladenine DNA glycosylase AlkD